MDLNILKEECKNYFPDIELKGDGNVDFGHNLADLIMKYGLNKEKKDFKIKKILSIHNPSYIFNSSRQRQLLKGILGRLKREAKIDIKDYFKMSTPEMWNYYISLRKEYSIS